MGSKSHEPGGRFVVFSARGGILPARPKSGVRVLGAFLAETWLAGDGGRPVRGARTGQHSISFLDRFLDDQRWSAGDFDGDGYDDLVDVRGVSGTASAWVHRSLDGDFERRSSVQSFAGFWPAQRWLAGNFGGREAEDLLNVYGISWPDASPLPKAN